MVSRSIRVNFGFAMLFFRVALERNTKVPLDWSVETSSL